MAPLPAIHPGQIGGSNRGVRSMRGRDLLPSKGQTFRVVTTLVLIAVVAPFVVHAVPGAIGADHSFVVLSGSMEPEINAGDVIMVREAGADEIQEGDVITFVEGEETDTPTTHKVIDVRQGENGPRYKTKGVANEDPDPGTVAPGQVIGTVWFVIPYVGYVVQFAGTQTGFIAMVVVPIALLLLSELADLIRDGRDDPTVHATAPGGPDDHGPSGPGATGSGDGDADDPARVTGAASDDPVEAVADWRTSLFDASEEDGETVTVTARDLRLTAGVLVATVGYAAFVVAQDIEGWSVGALVTFLAGLAFVGGIYLSLRGDDESTAIPTVEVPGAVRSAPRTVVGSLDALHRLAETSDSKVVRAAHSGAYLLPVDDVLYAHRPGATTVTAGETADSGEDEAGHEWDRITPDVDTDADPGGDSGGAPEVPGATGGKPEGTDPRPSTAVDRAVDRGGRHGPTPIPGPAGVREGGEAVAADSRPVLPAAPFVGLDLPVELATGEGVDVGGLGGSDRADGTVNPDGRSRPTGPGEADAVEPRADGNENEDDEEEPSTPGVVDLGPVDAPNAPEGVGVVASVDVPVTFEDGSGLDVDGEWDDSESVALPEGFEVWADEMTPPGDRAGGAVAASADAEAEGTPWTGADGAVAPAEATGVHPPESESGAGGPEFGAVADVTVAEEFECGAGFDLPAAAARGDQSPGDDPPTIPFRSGDPGETSNDSDTPDPDRRASRLDPFPDRPSDPAALDLESGTARTTDPEGQSESGDPSAAVSERPSPDPGTAFDWPRAGPEPEGTVGYRNDRGIGGDGAGPDGTDRPAESGNGSTVDARESDGGDPTSEAGAGADSPTGIEDRPTDANESGATDD